MSTYVGEIGKKIIAEVEMVNIYQYKDYNFSYYGTYHYIYTMKDTDGNVFVWKTTSFMGIDFGEYGYSIKKGDKISIKATVKEHSEYNGIKQTILSRCRYTLIEKAPVPPTKEELEEKKRKEQLETLKDGDFVWKMPYRQYKEHYADCETLVGSFEKDRHDGATIKVIIRAGRLKNSGVRGKRFYNFEVDGDDGLVYCFKAVSEENAIKQMKKEHPESKNLKVKVVN